MPSCTCRSAFAMSLVMTLAVETAMFFIISYLYCSLNFISTLFYWIYFCIKYLDNLYIQILPALKGCHFFKKKWAKRKGKELADETLSLYQILCQKCEYLNLSADVLSGCHCSLLAKSLVREAQTSNWQAQSGCSGYHPN